MDVRFFQSNDGGEIEYINGVASTDEGLEAAALISLMGGNDDDDGTDATADIQWWGNFVDDDESRAVRSQFQALTLTTPLNSATLQLFREAAEADMAWMIDEEIADEIELEASIVAPKKLALTGQIRVRTDVYPFTFKIQVSDT